VSAPSLTSRFGLRVHKPSHQGPSVHIYLQRLVRHANGMLSVTADCATLEAMEDEIEQLKRELDEMLRQTRRAFREHPGAAAAG
jgi:HAMP domain-containing protein